MPAHPSLTRIPLHPVAPVASVQGTLALALSPGSGTPELGVRPGADVGEVDPVVRQRFVQWAGRFCQVACDISVAARPATQLLRWTTPEIQLTLSRRARQHSVRRRDLRRPRVVSVRPSFLDDSTVEVAYRVAVGERYEAAAARFETHRDHWLCVALDLG